MTQIEHVKNNEVVRIEKQDGNESRISDEYFFITIEKNIIRNKTN